MTILGTNMKIKEHDEMIAYLTRPGKILANNINNKKFSHTERQRLAKGTKSDTTPTVKNNKMLEYINDINIIYGDKKATDAEKDAASKRQTLREATPKRRDTWKEFVASGGKKLPELSPEEIEKVRGDRRVRDYMLRNYRAEKPKPIKPDLPNGHSDWSTEELMDAIDPSWWLPDDDKKVEANSLYERYMELLKSGELLPGVTFQMFEANPIGYDPEAIAKMNKEINKRIAVKKSKEGLAALLAT